MRKRVAVRRHEVEALEVRTLLAADLLLDWSDLLEGEPEPTLPEGQIEFSPNTPIKPGQTLSLSIEDAGLPPPEQILEGEPVGHLHSISAEIIFTSSSSPVEYSTGTYSFGDSVYTIGQGDGLAVAHEWNSVTGEERTISLQNLSGTSEGSGLAWAMNEVGDEIFFVGRSFGDDGSRATVWDVDGSPTQAALSADIVGSAAWIHDITSTGIMTGQQVSIGVAWTPEGGAFRLPSTEISDLLGFGSTGRALTDDGRIIVGDIGGSGVVWKAVGDPMDGNFELVHYDYDEDFTYTMGLSDDGFAPGAGQFVIDTDAFGSIMFANYQTPEGWKSGAWSIEENGTFIRDFGPGRVQDVFVDAEGNIIVATNDDVVEMSGALWSFTESDPVYLKDLIDEEGFSNPYFTERGLFETEKGFGGLLEQDGSSTRLLVEFGISDDVGELKFDFGGTSAQVGSVDLLGMEEMPIYHEWQEAVGQVWFTIGEDLPPGLLDLSWQLTASAGSWLAEPEGLDSLGQSFDWDVQTVDSGDGGQSEIATFTLQGLDLSGFEVGDRVVIATIAYRPNPNNLVGVPADITGGYAEPTSAHGISLSQAGVVGGQELSIQAEVSGQFVPVIYDTDDNGRVGLSDFVQFISHYGQIPGPEYPGAYRFDFNRDGRVGLSDFVLFIQHYGASQSSGRSIVMPGLQEPTPPPIMESEPSGSLDTHIGHKGRVHVAYDASPPGEFFALAPEVDDHSTTFRWTHSAGASAYQVWLREEQQTEFFPLPETTSVQNLTLDTPLVSGTYELLIKAWDDAGNERLSEVWGFEI